MTCIAALVDGGTVYMGADSAGSSPNGTLQIRKDPKVFRVGELLIGFTSSFRMGQILRYNIEIPQIQDDIEPYQWMVKTFIPIIRQAFKDGGFLQEWGEQEHGGTFLVGLRGRLFQVGGDFQVGETAYPYDAVGSGGKVASGTLYATQAIASLVGDAAAAIITPEWRVRTALAAAEQLSAGVRSPFHVLSAPPAQPPQVTTEE